jgi:hypothetical protein
LDGNHYKSNTFSTFTITFVIKPTTNTGRSTGYGTTNGKSGETTYF